MSDLPSGLNSHNLAFVEHLYTQYAEDPQQVPAEWRAYFDSWGHNGAFADSVDERKPRAKTIFRSPSVSDGPRDTEMESAVLQERLDQLIRAYRVRGHLKAKLDPLGLPRSGTVELEPSFYGFGDQDMERRFSARNLGGKAVLSLREIIERLERTYCGHIGVQFMHIDDLEKKNWIQHRVDDTQNQVELTRAQQLRVLTKLSDAEIFEQFIHRKFLGAKRFSLEGGESLIPLIDLALEEAAEAGVGEAVIGMAHRGRLNVLANIMGKDASQIFREFEDAEAERFQGKGDVKYHMGYSAEHETQHGKKMHLSLCFNPSHLEFVGPVLAGRVRAKQDRINDTERRKVLPIVIHGDAAFAGQGIVAELLNSSELDGYTVGGTLHIIVNNQVGFTTSPRYSRPGPYPSDIAKLLQIPIIHVNGEHPDAVYQAVRLAMDFRHTFQTDVVIDMWCYRLHGHNEGDDPAFTQPVMYDAIRKRKTVREAFLDNVIKMGVIRMDDAREIAAQRKAILEEALLEAKDPSYVYLEDTGRGLWAPYHGGRSEHVPEVETHVERERCAALLLAQAQLPDDFESHPKIKRLFNQRAQMAHGEKPLDWGAAEAIAFASLLQDGAPIRLSGQDSGRGTFSHRHSVLRDYRTGNRHIPLNHIDGVKASFEVIDSPLSEAAILGFDYGYSLDMPEGLTIWEAQFGDFANGAQVIIDQFIASSEDKWQRLSGLVMLLPHGFEGQGPEHSSARLERFLGLCAEHNMQVCNLTTPAQLFHCLRRHIHRPYRKPLVIMSPKSLLRHRRAVSTLEELASGAFKPVIGDSVVTDPKKIKKVILCSGKVYYDLIDAREASDIEEIAIHRIEQLYPLYESDFMPLIEKCAPGTPVTWVQEEPFNMGAWPFLKLRFGVTLGDGAYPFDFVARHASASPATGSGASHRLEQKNLLERALTI